MQEVVWRIPFLKISSRRSNQLLWAVLPLTALLVRLGLATDHPVFSNDSYRYVWDGNAVLHGVNPLAHRPDAPEIAFLRSTAPLPPDHSDIASIYPPLAQLYFATAVFVKASPISFSIFSSIFDSISVLILMFVLRRREKNLWWAALFAWHPISILESGHSGHVDSLGILFLSMMLLAIPNRPRMASIFVSMAGLVKLWPISLLFAFSPKRETVAAWFLFVVPCVLAWGMGGNVDGLFTYAHHWEFQGPLYTLFRLVVSGLFARSFCAVLALSAIGVLMHDTKLEFEEKALWVVGTYLICSPTVYPWYTLWLLPILVILPRWEWVYLTLATALSYVVLERYLTERIWEEPKWALGVVYLPFFVGIGLRARKSLEERRKSRVEIGQ